MGEMAPRKQSKDKAKAYEIMLAEKTIKTKPNHILLETAISIRVKFTNWSKIKTSKKTLTLKYTSE